MCTVHLNIPKNKGQTTDNFGKIEMYNFAYNVATNCHLSHVDPCVMTRTIALILTLCHKESIDVQWQVPESPENKQKQAGQNVQHKGGAQ